MSSQPNIHNAPLVTIAIPTYNRADGYLKNAIECAAEQQYDNIEIIVSDNCSSDDTSQLMSNYAGISNLNYIRHEKNIGANNNFNHCLQEATGEYFLMLHDDDAIDANFISSCMSTLGSGPPPGLIRTGTKVIDADGNVTDTMENHMQVEKPVDLVTSWFSWQSAMYLCSTLFNTDALRQAGGFQSPKNLLQDTFAEIKIAANHPVANIVEPLASFRIHTAELTHAAKVIDWCEDSRHLLNLICELFPDHSKQLRADGNIFFSRLNYRRTDSMPWSIKKLRTYSEVAKYFDNASPASNHILKKVKNRLGL